MVFDRFWLIVFVALLIYSNAWGADSSDEYFCYQHEETGAMMFDCKKILPPNSAFEEIYCYDDVKEDYVIFKKNDEWKEIEGKNSLCQKKKIKTKSVPKGAL